MLNAYNMFIKRTGQKSSLQLFRKAIISQLFAKYCTTVATRSGQQSTEALDRLSACNFVSRHFLQHLPLSESGRTKQQDCVVCMHAEKRPSKRKRVTLWCPECKVPLCVGDCFQGYHTLQRFSSEIYEIVNMSIKFACTKNKKNSRIRMYLIRRKQCDSDQCMPQLYYNDYHTSLSSKV